MWGEETIRILLKEFKSRRSRYKDGLTEEFWEELVEEFQKKKHYFTAAQVAYRWNMLLVTFQKPQNSDNPQERFKYYDEMKEFAENEEVDKTIVASVGASSELMYLNYLFLLICYLADSCLKGVNAYFYG
jgi:hypothetical protein